MHEKILKSSNDSDDESVWVIGLKKVVEQAIKSNSFVPGNHLINHFTKLISLIFHLPFSADTPFEGAGRPTTTSRDFGSGGLDLLGLFLGLTEEEGGK